MANHNNALRQAMIITSMERDIRVLQRSASMMATLIPAGPAIKGIARGNHPDICVLALGLGMLLIAVTHPFVLGPCHGYGHEQYKNTAGDTEIAYCDPKKTEHVITCKHRDNHYDENSNRGCHCYLHPLGLRHTPGKAQEHRNEHKRVEHDEEACGYLDIIGIVHNSS